MSFEEIIKNLEDASKQLELWAAAPQNVNHIIANDVDVIGWDVLCSASSLRQIVNHFGTK